MLTGEVPCRKGASTVVSDCNDSEDNIVSMEELFSHVAELLDSACRIVDDDSVE